MNVPEIVLAAMRQTNEVFSAEVVVRRDTSRLDRVYTANARVLPPGAAMIEGRENIKAFWEQAIKALELKSAKLETVQAEVAGESVVEIGKADLELGSGQTLTVKYVIHWKREDGHWKWHLDIWNPNS